MPTYGIEREGIEIAVYCFHHLQHAVYTLRRAPHEHENFRNVFQPNERLVDDLVERLFSMIAAQTACNSKPSLLGLRSIDLRDFLLDWGVVGDERYSGARPSSSASTAAFSAGVLSAEC